MARRGALLFWRAVNTDGNGAAATVYDRGLFDSTARARELARVLPLAPVRFGSYTGRGHGAAVGGGDRDDDSYEFCVIPSPPPAAAAGGIERAPRSVRFPFRLDWRRAADQWGADRRNG